MLELLFATAILTDASVVDAEREYAAMAQRSGQWTAFRATAAPDAVLFVPSPVVAADWLKSRADPPVAVKWQPSEALVSCDGLTAVTYGPWQRPTSNGYFVTIWTRSQEGWRWKVDFGDALDQPLPAAPAVVPVHQSSCSRTRLGRLTMAKNEHSAAGQSADRSLEWEWHLDQDGSPHLTIRQWDGTQSRVVLEKIVKPNRN